MFHTGWPLTDLIRASKRNLCKSERKKQITGEEKQKKYSKIIIMAVTNPMALYWNYRYQ